jgi:hypothetical protein
MLARHFVHAWLSLGQLTRLDYFHGPTTHKTNWNPPNQSPARIDAKQL